MRLLHPYPEGPHLTTTASSKNSIRRMSKQQKMTSVIAERVGLAHFPSEDPWAGTACKKTLYAESFAQKGISRRHHVPCRLVRMRITSHPI
jgi:hypothetical protein